MDILIGQTLGKYQVVARLGQGGMARVYKGYQTTLDRYVAIKVMHTHLVHESDFISRFEREATHIAKLRNNNIVQVYDFDVIDDNYYMVMEYIDGPSLRHELEQRIHHHYYSSPNTTPAPTPADDTPSRSAIISPTALVNNRNPPFSFKETAVILTNLAHAIDYAHAHNMIHRDIKPGNILFTKDGQPLLTDFGLARIIGDTNDLSQPGHITGTPAYMSPEQCRGEDVDSRSDIYALSVILYELITGQPPFTNDTPLAVILQHLTDPFPYLDQACVPDTVKDVILKASQKKPDDRYQSAIEMATAFCQAVGQSINKVGATIAIQANIEHKDEIEPTITASRFITNNQEIANPYRGLYAFREKDAPYFFGRDLFTKRLIKYIEEYAMVTVVGPSGSGKSSVVFAGLIPHLRDAGNWLIVRCRPGAKPFQNLGAALIPLLEPNLNETAQLAASKKLGTALQTQTLHLYDVTQHILQKHPHHNRLLLVSDQFEELFTLCDDPQIQQTYPNLLFTAVKTGQTTTHSPPFSLAITLRADFVGQALAYRPFADALQDNDVKLGPMTRQELSEAIEKPAKMHGVLFETGLVNRILNDVGHEPGNLPLLEFALTLLWEHRNGRRLTHTTYEQIGYVEGALARYADEIYNGLSPTNQARARKVFTQMVRPGEGTEDTRRLATQKELDATDWALVNYLADRRLVVTGRSSEGQRTVEVVHEALIRGWQQLRQWMNTDRAFRTWQERLRAAMSQWHTSDQDTDALLRGALLAEAEGWQAERQPDLSADEHAFINASSQLRQQHLADIETQRQRELETAKQLAEAQQHRADAEHKRAEAQTRASQRLRTLAIGLAIIFVLALATAAFANTQRQNARTAQAEAETAANARATEVIVRSTAEAQAITNANIAATQEAGANAAQATAEAERIRADQEAEEAKASQRIADEQAKLALARQLAAQSTNLVYNQLDLALLLSVEATSRIQTAETRSSLLAALLANPRVQTFLHQERLIQSIQFSPDGQMLLSAGESGDIRLWDTTTRQLIRTFVGHSPQELVNTATFSPDGQTIASVSDDQTIILWDVATGEPRYPPLTEHSGFVQTVAFSPNGQLFATAGGGGDYAVRLWDATTGQRLLEPLTGHLRSVWALAFSPDGQTVASASFDTTIRLWDVNTGALLNQFVGHNGRVLTIAFNPDGTRLASGGHNDDSNIIIWDVATATPIGQPLSGHVAGISGLAFSRDGQHLYSSGIDGTIRLWETGTHNANNTAQTIGPIFSGHVGQIAALDLSADGQQLASGDGSGNIIIWDLSSHIWPVTDQLSGHKSLVRDVTYSPTGEWLASAGGDNEIKLWREDMTPHTLIHEAETEVPIQSLTFSPSGQLVASGSANGTVLLWNEQGEAQSLVAPLSAHPNGVTALAISADQNSLATGSNLGTILLWNLQTAQPYDNMSGLAGHADKVNAITFSNSGTHMASVSDDAALIIRNITFNEFETLGMPLIDPDAPETPLLSVAFSPQGQVVATGNANGRITFWHVEQREPIDTLTLPTGTAINHITFNDDGTSFAAGSADGTVMVWQLTNMTADSLAQGRTFAAQAFPLEHPSSVASLTFTLDDTLIAISNDALTSQWHIENQSIRFESTKIEDATVVASNSKTAVFGRPDGTLDFYTLASERTLIASQSHHTQNIADVTEIAFHPEGHIFASSSVAGVINIWDTATQTRLTAPLVGHTARVWSLTFSPDGQWLVSTGCHKISRFGLCTIGELLLWDMDTYQFQRLLVETGIVFDAVFHPNGRSLYITGCAVPVDPLNGCLQAAVTELTITDPLVGTTQTAKIANNYIGAAGLVTILALSPDATLLVAGDSNATINVWDINEQQQIRHRITAHNGPIRDIAFNPDGTLLASASIDNTLMLSDVATGQVIGKPIARHRGSNGLTSIAWHPQIPQLASGGTDANVLLWDIDQTKWQTRACQIANRNLTEGEWQQFFGEESYQQTCTNVQ